VLEGHIKILSATSCTVHEYTSWRDPSYEYGRYHNKV